MDNDILMTHLKTLKELLLDENKVVTYISLSKELCIHVNEAKSLLSKVVEDISKTQPNISLNVNYIISGLVENNRARTIVCTETDVATHTSTLKTVFFKHIYSISQGVPCVDNVAFAAINKFEDFPLCTGLIKGNLCLKRTLCEINNLKSSSQEVVNGSKCNNQPTVKKEIYRINLPKNGFAEDKNFSETKPELIIKSEKSSPKKDLSSTSNGRTVSTKTDKKVSKGIAGFFTRSNNKGTDSSTKMAKESIPVPIVKAENKEKVEVMEVDNVPIEKELKSNSRDNIKKNKSLNQIRKNAKVDKKRKRVLHVSDSESESEANDPFEDETLPRFNNESEDEIPPTPTVNTVKITSGILNPKKRRKIVDKTYTDEDGYILTRKEEIYESCSENEEEAVNTKENVEKVNQIKIENEISPKEKKKNSKKKVSPPQKGKQATLMNFFKKI